MNILSHIRTQSILATYFTTRPSFFPSHYFALFFLPALLFLLNGQVILADGEVDLGGAGGALRAAVAAAFVDDVLENLILADDIEHHVLGAGAAVGSKLEGAGTLRRCRR